MIIQFERSYPRISVFDMYNRNFDFEIPTAGQADLIPSQMSILQ